MGLTLPDDFGYVLLTGTASAFVLMWQGSRVMRARKEYGVTYPKMYSDDNNGQNTFNCIQRCHQNTLENYPQFLFLLTSAGLGWPRTAAAAGLVWIAGRVAYTIGYSSGKPEKRMWGVFGYAGLLTLLGATVHTACNAIKWE